MGLPEAFVLFGIVLVGVYVLVAMPRRPKSGFRVRESDRVQAPELPQGTLPHEILGISETASKREIQKAFRAAMKRFHPDRIGERGHGISQRLIAARDAMLARHS